VRSAGRLQGSWKSYAIAYEAFCEACTDADRVGAKNATAEIRVVVTAFRSQEYDA